MNKSCHVDASGRTTTTVVRENIVVLIHLKPFDTFLYPIHHINPLNKITCDVFLVETVEGLIHHPVHVHVAACKPFSL